MERKSKKAFLKLYCVICFLDVVIVYLRIWPFFFLEMGKKLQQRSEIIGELNLVNIYHKQLKFLN
jgi:branched-subunit amino acid transport protein AzlD